MKGPRINITKKLPNILLEIVTLAGFFSLRARITHGNVALQGWVGTLTREKREEKEEAPRVRRKGEKERRIL